MTAREGDQGIQYPDLSLFLPSDLLLVLSVSGVQPENQRTWEPSDVILQVRPLDGGEREGSGSEETKKT